MRENKFLIVFRKNVWTEKERKSCSWFIVDYKLEIIFESIKRESSFTILSNLFFKHSSSNKIKLQIYNFKFTILKISQFKK